MRRIQQLWCWVFVFWLVGCGALSAKECYVAKHGNDQNPGTLKSPFATIGKGVKTLQPGDTLFIKEGVYRESVNLKCSGTADEPITIQAVGLDDVVISGVDRVTSKWTLREPVKRIYALRLAPKWLSQSIIDNHFQVFVDKQPLLPARWPNCRYDEVLTRKGWCPGGKDARYGHFNVPALKGSKLDLQGVDIYLNIVHQFFTWKRKVSAFDPMTGRIEYPQDIPVAPEFFEKGSYWDRQSWKDDYFYLQGDYGLLDYPGEFHYDAETGALFIIPPNGENPNNANVEIKTRIYGLEGSRLAHVTLRGIDLFGCSLRLANCNDMLLSGLTLRYPTSAQGVREVEPKNKIESVYPRIYGNRNIVRDVYLAHSTTSGLFVNGTANRLENSIIHDCGYSGSLTEKCVGFGGASVMRRCTVFNSGNVSVGVGGGCLFELNHVFNSGILSHDVSAVYTGGDKAMKTRITHNWVHDNRSSSLSNAIRGDDLTRGLTVDHNVVWNVEKGIVAKGDHNSVFNNTVFNASRYDILMPTHPEPRKIRQVEAGKTFLDVQNSNSRYYNNLVNDEASSKQIPPPSIVVGDKGPNYIYDSTPPLVDVAAYDLRPLPTQRDKLKGAPLPQDGVLPVELDESSQPYIGAYGFDGPYWIPGAKHGMQYLLVESNGKQMLRFKYTLPLLADDSLAVSFNGNRLLSEGGAKEGSFKAFTLPVALEAGPNSVAFESKLFGTIKAEVVADDLGKVRSKQFPRLSRPTSQTSSAHSQ